MYGVPQANISDNKLSNSQSSLPYSHGECVDVLIELVDKCNCLNDHVIHTVNIELDLSAGVSMAKAKLSFDSSNRRQTGDKFWKVHANAT